MKTEDIILWIAGVGAVGVAGYVIYKRRKDAASVPALVYTPAAASSLVAQSPPPAPAANPVAALIDTIQEVFTPAPVQQPVPSAPYPTEPSPYYAPAPVVVDQGDVYNAPVYNPPPAPYVPPVYTPPPSEGSATYYAEVRNTEDYNPLVSVDSLQGFSGLLTFGRIRL